MLGTSSENSEQQGIDFHVLGEEWEQLVNHLFETGPEHVEQHGMDLDVPGDEPEHVMNQLPLQENVTGLGRILEDIVVIASYGTCKK